MSSRDTNHTELASLLRQDIAGGSYNGDEWIYAQPPGKIEPGPMRALKEAEQGTTLSFPQICSVHGTAAVKSGLPSQW